MQDEVIVQSPVEYHGKRLVIESLHELGHVFSLDDHEQVRKTDNGKYCPMTMAHENDAWIGIISWADYISYRDSNSFCAECHDDLHESTVKKLKRYLFA